jgi:N-terminal domain of (some) glycogen debranching enzymes
LVEGSSFCISLANGDIHPEHPHGLFVLDTRILSGWRFTISGLPLEPLAVETKEPYRALFVGRVSRSDGYADSPLIVERLREVGAATQEQVTVHNYSRDPAECVISLTIKTDFADLFEVKEARTLRRWDETRHVDGGSLAIRAVWHDVRKGVLIQAPGADITPGSPHIRGDYPVARKLEHCPHRRVVHRGSQPRGGFRPF